MFKSTDGGANWNVVWSEPGPNPYVNWVQALAIDPVTPTTLYAGTGGSGVFKSTDGGTTWKVGSGLTAAFALAIDPLTPTTLYAGTGGPGYVFKSTDGGASWSAVDSGPRQQRCHRPGHRPPDPEHPL